MTERINCLIADCRKCKYHIIIKKNYFGDEIYICDFIAKKHKRIKAQDCGHFQCNTFDEHILCNDCKQKILSLKK